MDSTLFYLSLFWGTLLPATIIPFSSEAVFATAISLSSHPPLAIIGVASLGNCAGVTINYLIGLKGITYLLDRFGFDDERREYYHKKFLRYDKYLLLASVLPVVGDPITIYAGVAGIRFLQFGAIVYSLRIGRYILIYLLIKGAG